MLENTNLGDYTVADAFIKKCSDSGDLKYKVKALNTQNNQAKSILFDISKKANIDNKKDAVIEVFVNVFNEVCGYYGKSRPIGQFERHLDEDGKFNAFKEEFKKMSGMDWQNGRVRPGFNEYIDKVYNRLYNTECKEILNRYKRNDSDIVTSAETFAESVYNYLEKQPSNYRINFLIDEVGQYIGYDTSLILQLQAITEQLSKKCKGKVSVIVTS